MPATTVSQKYVSTDGVKRAIKKVKNRKVAVPGDPDKDLYVLKVVSETIATTSLDDADDKVEFFTYPVGAKLVDLVVDFDDLDSAGGPALVVDIDAGSTTLINNSTAGQTGAVDELDANLRFVTDISGQTLKMTVVTPATTPAAGTVTIYTSFYMGDYVTL